MLRFTRSAATVCVCMCVCVCVCVRACGHPMLPTHTDLTWNHTLTHARIELTPGPTYGALWPGHIVCPLGPCPRLAQSLFLMKQNVTQHIRPSIEKDRRHF